MPTIKPYLAARATSIRLIILTLSALIITNCANNNDLYSSEDSNNSPLIVPANLSSAKLNNSYAIVNKNTIDPQNQLQSNLMQNGKQIWLELNNQDLPNTFALMQSYIKNLGLTISLQDPSVARIETDWATTHNKVTDKSGVRYLFDKIGLGKMYSLPSKYRFIINLWQDNNIVKIFVTVEEANEEYLTGHAPENNRSPSETQQTKWVMLAPKIQNEINFLNSFVTFANTNQIVTNSNENAITLQPSQATLNNGVITINSDIDTAFNKTIASLNKANLGVVSINKDNYQIVVYPLPVYNQEANNDGWFDKLFSRKKNNKNASIKYLITLTSNTDSTTSLSMADATSDKDNTPSKPNELNSYLTQLLAQLQ